MGEQHEKRNSVFTCICPCGGIHCPLFVRNDQGNRVAIAIHPIHGRGNVDLFKNEFQNR